jgi:hypothetical protein
MSTDSIGTAGTHTDITTWEAQLDPSGLGEPETGMGLAEEFAESITFNGEAPTATNYVKLTADDGTFTSSAEHDGRSHDVSGAGNARIVATAMAKAIYCRDPFVEISWMEVKGPAARNERGIVMNGGAASDWMRLHHCIFHNDHSGGGTASTGIYPTDDDMIMAVYRNIVYGYESNGIYNSLLASSSGTYYNTLFENNNGAEANQAGLTAFDTDGVHKYNASFENPSEDYRNLGRGTWDQNASSDATGDDDVDNLTTANQFANPTTTWASCDLTVKAGADLIGQGTSISDGNFPDIDQSADNRGVSVSNWDLGACEYVAGGAFGGQNHVVGGGLVV